MMILMNMNQILIKIIEKDLNDLEEYFKEINKDNGFINIYDLKNIMKNIKYLYLKKIQH